MTGRIAVQQGTSCNANPDTFVADPAITNLALEDGVAMTTGWTVCFNSRGLAVTVPGINSIQLSEVEGEAASRVANLNVLQGGSTNISIQDVALPPEG